MTTDNSDHDCTKVKNLKSPSAIEPVGAEVLVQRFNCSVCGNRVIETFRLESREVADE